MLLFNRPFRTCTGVFLLGIRIGQRCEVDRRPPGLRATPNVGGPGAGVIDEDPPHGLRRRGVEVAATRPGDLPRTGELQVGLVDQRGGGQGMTGPLIGKMTLGCPSELIEHQRQQAIGGRLVAIRGGDHQESGVLMSIW